MRLKRSLPVCPAVDPSAAAQHLAQCLQAIHAKHVDVEGARVRFRGGVNAPVSRQHVLHTFDAGEVIVGREGRLLIYDLSFGRSALMCGTVAGAMTAAMLISGYLGKPASHFVLGVMLLLGAFGLSLKISLRRFESFLEKSLMTIPGRCRRRFCVNCGYDLRATPERCPECGTVPTLPEPTG